MVSSTAGSFSVESLESHGQWTVAPVGAAQAALRRAGIVQASAAIAPPVVPVPNGAKLQSPSIGAVGDVAAAEAGGLSIAFASYS